MKSKPYSSRNKDNFFKDFIKMFAPLVGLWLLVIAIIFTAVFFLSKNIIDAAVNYAGQYRIEECERTLISSCLAGDKTAEECRTFAEKQCAKP